MKVIYIHTHDTGRFIEPYGYNIPTPNLMKMAQEGTLFRNAHCAAPTCTPSRTAMLLGMAPHSCGMFGLTNMGFRMEEYSRHIVSFLNEKGYDTALSGVHHEFHSKDAHTYKTVVNDIHDEKKNLYNTGFDELDMDSAQKAAEYIKTNIDKDYFLSVGFINTHRPFPPHVDNVNPDYVMPPFPFPDTRETREDMAAYIKSAKTMDKCVGIVLDAIYEAGIEDDAVVFFTTDHGIAFPRMKCHLYDTGTGVSLIMMVPGNRRKGKACDALISQIDIFPTLCDYLGLGKPNWLQGRSIKPILDGSAEEINSEIFSEVTYHAAYEPMRAIRTQRYKLIKTFDDYDRPVPSNTDDGISKELYAKWGYFEGKKDKEMLFDLYLDPVERVNLVGDIRYAEIYRDLSMRLEKWMKETDDPLLKGKIVAPKGARVCKPDSYSIALGEFEPDTKE